LLAVDCTIFSSGVPIPLDPSATPSAAVFAGVPVDIQPQATITLPASLVCGFTDVVAFGAISNSQLTFDITGGTPTSQQVWSFVDDGSQSPTLVSPHSQTIFDFFAACGNAAGTCSGGTCSSDGTTSCTTDDDCEETGPGILLPFLPRTSDPAVPGTTSVTPAAPGVLRFTYEYATLELPILTPILGLCIGGQCMGGVPCPIGERTGSGDGICSQFPPGSPGNCTADDSPRIMYDANCDKLGVLGETCSPFENFGEAANICATGQPGTSLNPAAEEGVCGSCTPTSCGEPVDEGGLGPCTCDRDDCCDFVQANYPTATSAQFPVVPVNPAP
jgi:hypothetical protein